MIQNKTDYRYYLNRDALCFKEVSGRAGFRNWLLNRLLSTPISDQSQIWRYIKTLRKCEFYHNTRLSSSLCVGVKILLYLYNLHKLRKLSRITGFQIHLNTIGPGLTIWHWGAIIINGNSRIGENVTIRPDVVVGFKDENGPAPIIGDNVTLNSGCRIIGNGIVIGDNVIIAPGAIVTKSFPSNCIVAGCPAKVIRYFNV